MSGWNLHRQSQCWVFSGQILFARKSLRFHLTLLHATPYVIYGVYGVTYIGYIQYHVYLIYTMLRIYSFIWLYCTPPHTSPAHWKGGGGRMRDPWEKHPRRRGDGYWPGADEISGKKSWKNYFRVVEDVCGWAAAVSWISIFQDWPEAQELTTKSSPGSFPTTLRTSIFSALSSQLSLQ